MRLSSGNLIDDLEKWKKMYINSLKGKSYAKNTIELYSRAINFFIEHMREFQDDLDIRNIKNGNFSNFLVYIEEEARRKGTIKINQSIQKSTKNSYIKAIKGLFTYIGLNNDEEHSYERHLVGIGVKDSSKPQDKIRYLSEDKIDKLTHYLDRILLKKKTYNAYRDSLLIKLLLHSGLRISEALHIKLKDIIVSESDQDMCDVKVFAKGQKIQHSKIVKDKIIDEIEYFYNKSLLKKDDYIFVTRTGKLLRRDSAYKTVANHYARAGFNLKGLHILRHTLAMQLTLNEVNPLTIKEALRHSSLSSTTVYAQATDKQVSSALKTLK